jgi:hypothetical protein
MYNPPPMVTLSSQQPPIFNFLLAFTSPTFNFLRYNITNFIVVLYNFPLSFSDAFLSQITFEEILYFIHLACIL